jgi:hypothetical protein
MTISGPSLILTPAEIARWTEDCAQIDASIEKLHRKRGEIEKKLEAARLLAPSLFEVATQKSLSGSKMLKRKGLTTWPHIIEEQVRASGDGIRQKDMLEQLRTGPYASRFQGRNESGYYNAVQKVLGRGDVIKRGDWLFTPAQYDAYLERLARGEVKDVADEADYGSPAAAEAVRFIAANPGVRSIAVIRAIWDAHEGAHPPSKTSLYNTLARLVEQKKIRKDESGAFYLPNANEAPAGQPGGASEAGEVDASPDENRRGFRVIG